MQVGELWKRVPVPEVVGGELADRCLVAYCDVAGGEFRRCGRGRVFGAAAVGRWWFCPLAEGSCAMATLCELCSAPDMTSGRKRVVALRPWANFRRCGRGQVVVSPTRGGVVRYGDPSANYVARPI